MTNIGPRIVMGALVTAVGYAATFGASALATGCGDQSSSGTDGSPGGGSDTGAKSDGGQSGGDGGGSDGGGGSCTATLSAALCSADAAGGGCVGVPTGPSTIQGSTQYPVGCQATLPDSCSATPVCTCTAQSGGAPQWECKSQ